MKEIDLYLQHHGIDVSTIPADLYHKLEELHTNWAFNNSCATMALCEKSYSPYSTDYRYIQFSRLAEYNKAMLEEEVAKLTNSKTRK